MSKKIQIFYSDYCFACHEAMDFFKKNNLEFISYKVTWDKNGELIDSKNSRKMKKWCGDNVDTVPQIIIDGKLIGNYGALTKLIEKGTFF